MLLRLELEETSGCSVFEALSRSLFDWSNVGVISAVLSLSICDFSRARFSVLLLVALKIKQMGDYYALMYIYHTALIAKEKPSVCLRTKVKGLQFFVVVYKCKL